MPCARTGAAAFGRLAGGPVLVGPPGTAARAIGQAEQNVGLGLANTKAVTMKAPSYTPTPGAQPSPETQFFFPRDWHS
eukprot:6287747-Alexandrium_andersonii.AAC.1